MKKSLSVILVIAAVVIIAVVWGVRLNNKMVTADENVGKAWANVESSYQRRSDLIPNLVATVKGAADFEKSTLEAVISARASATQTTIDASNLTEENIAAFQSVQDNLSSAIGRLLVSVEKYPELKANQNFLELQAQLEGTENRIAIARKDFNDLVMSYNSLIRKFPASIIAGFGGFDKKAYFKAAEGSDKAPQVQF